MFCETEPPQIYHVSASQRWFSSGTRVTPFMEMNKPTSWPKRLRRCLHLAFRCLFETPSYFSGTNFDRREFPLLPTWAVGKSWSRLLDGQRHAQLSALPRVECVACFRVITGHDYLQAHLFKIGLADSPLYLLCKSRPMTGEHLTDCPALLHVLSQDNCGVRLLIERYLLYIGLQDALCPRGRCRA
ncbi:gag-Pol polyprotein [Trichonephila clavipes]|nr:gag-Pol polyprotein [Trichonephila clavipes]